MMRFFVWLMVCCCLFFLFPTVGQSEKAIDPSAEHAVVIEQSTGRVLYEKAVHEKKPVASITKVMTALVALEYGELDDTVVVSSKAANANGSSIYLEENEEVSLEDLLYGLMLRSGNDAAVAIAEHIGGSEEGFVYLMNEKAAYLGMTNTHFTNPHGLDEMAHYSTAYDMALLMRSAMDNESFNEISGTTSYQSDNYAYPWQNKNKLLTQLYDASTGGKTGFTNKAGRTLISSAKKHHLSLIIVTLNAPDDWNDHISLYEWAFDQYSFKKIEKKGLKNIEFEDEKRLGYIADDFMFPIHETEIEKSRKEIKLNNDSDQATLGVIHFLIEDESVLEIPMYKRQQASYVDHFIYVWSKLLRIDSYG